MKPVLLWSDLLFFLLIAVAVGGFWWGRRQEHLRDGWARVARRPAGMAAATVLAVFLLVGVLDSLHYRLPLPAEPGKPAAYAVEVLSALDACCCR